MNELAVSGVLVLKDGSIGGHRVISVTLRSQQALQEDRSNEGVLIPAALVLGACEDYFETGTADPDVNMHLSRLEERIAQLRNSGCPDFSKITWDIENALNVLKGNGKLELAQLKLLPQIKSLLLARAEDIWTTPSAA